jgi:hypothetical protein
VAREECRLVISAKRLTHGVSRHRVRCFNTQRDLLQIYLKHPLFRVKTRIQGVELDVLKETPASAFAVRRRGVDVFPFFSSGMNASFPVL